MSREQFSTRGKAAIDQIISKRCLIYPNHSTCSSITLTSSDLAGCYNCIVHKDAAFALLRVGIPELKIISMFDSIQRMIHMIITTYWDYDISYGGDDIVKWEIIPKGVS